MRAAAATAAAILGVVAALAAAALWTAGRDVLDEDRFARHAVASLVSTPGREALTVTVARRLHDRTTTTTPIPARVYAVARVAVDRLASAPGLAAALEGALAAAHRAVLAHPGDPAEIDLAAIREPLAARMDDVDPRLAATLRSAPDLGVRVATGLEVPARTDR